MPGSGLADHSHTVLPGQTLSQIARRYQVSTGTLAAANSITPDGMLRPGQVLVVPAQGVVYVRQGQTLSTIARAHEVSVQALARANRIAEDATIRPGQQLMLPGYRPAEEQRQATRRWGEPRNPGVATLIRVQSSQRARIRLVDRRGRTRSAAIRQLMPLMRPRRGGRPLPPHRRLISSLARISDHFGGRPILVVSGYRPARGYTRATSRHTQGRALDIRVQGVPNTTVRDFCRTLPQMGCGYYPRSTFVHVDVRDDATYWIDWSGPGQRPRYGRADEGPPEESEEGEVEEVEAEGADQQPSTPEPAAEPDEAPPGGLAEAATSSE